MAQPFSPSALPILHHFLSHYRKHYQEEEINFKLNLLENRKKPSKENNVTIKKAYPDYIRIGF